MVVLILSIYAMFSKTGMSIIKNGLGIIKSPTKEQEYENNNETHSGGATPNLDITLTKFETGVSRL
jgi:hypothetical protein